MPFPLREEEEEEEEEEEGSTSTRGHSAAPAGRGTAPTRVRPPAVPWKACTRGSTSTLAPITRSSGTRHVAARLVASVPPFTTTLAAAAAEEEEVGKVGKEDKEEEEKVVGDKVEGIAMGLLALLP